MGAIAPRQLLVVSGTEDKHAADADELIERARPGFASASRALEHLRAHGGHTLHQERFQCIIDWMVDTAASAR